MKKKLKIVIVVLAIIIFSLFTIEVIKDINRSQPETVQPAPLK